MFLLSGESVDFAIDDTGRLTCLMNKNVGHDYAGGGGLWRLIYSRGADLERMAIAENSMPVIERKNDVLHIVYNSIIGQQVEHLAVELHLTAAIKQDSIEFSAEIKNNEEGVVIRELHFPLIHKCKIEKGQRFIWSRTGGERFDDILSKVRTHHTQYKAKDNFEIRMSSLYPGFSATNAYVFENETEGLYVASHDLSFHYTLHLLAANNDGLLATMVKYPFVGHGESWRAEGYVLSPYQGDWHAAANKYRDWVKEWFHQLPMQKLVQNMKGWQRIIMRHQYGEIHYRYDQLEQIYHDGMVSGIDTLFLFGWHKDGHDAGYPEYVGDPEQGGLPALKCNIEKVQNAGGKVILYFNGQLIDRSTEYYKTTGHQLSVKRADGNEHMEVYPFGGYGTALREFGNKTFVTGCPACEGWLDVLCRCVDTSVELGVDGIFFDQLGLISSPCFDSTHGHRTPLMDIMHYKAQMIRMLREYIQSKSPTMALGIEWLSDVTVQHVDYVHNMNPGSRADNDWLGNSEPPYMTGFVEWFYYIFPHVRTTDREIRDDNDIERRVNFALLRGLRSDVEIYRCRRTIVESPKYCQYLKQANHLRDKYSDLILNGIFCDHDHFRCDNSAIDAKCFYNSGRLAVLLTQSHDVELSGGVKVDGFELIETNGLGDFRVVSLSTNECRVTLPRHSLVLLIYRQTK